MSERRVSNETLAINTDYYRREERWFRENDVKFYGEAAKHLDLVDVRATLATTQAALKDVERQRDCSTANFIALQDALDAERLAHVQREQANARAEAAEAALKDVRAEIAAAERRGMERAAEMIETAETEQSWLRVKRRLRQVAAKVRTAALPPPSDAAPAASEDAS